MSTVSRFRPNQCSLRKADRSVPCEREHNGECYHHHRPQLQRVAFNLDCRTETLSTTASKSGAVPKIIALMAS